MHKRLALALLLATGGLLSTPPAAAQLPNSGYQLGPEDQIEVVVFGQPDMTVRTRIKSDGTITVPLVGSVPAAGQNVQSLAADIARRLQSGGYLKSPLVNVEILAYVSRLVTVLGQVAQPGNFPLDRPQTLGDMIARTGGVRPAAGDVVLLRHAGSSQAERILLSELALNSSRDVALRPGDVVFVPEADLFYIYGQIGSAGAYPIRAGMTIRQALARGGGPTLAGSEKRVSVYRNGKESDADLEARVQPNDVIFVRERVF